MIFQETRQTGKLHSRIINRKAPAVAMTLRKGALSLACDAPLQMLRILFECRILVRGTRLKEPEALLLICA